MASSKRIKLDESSIIKGTMFPVLSDDLVQSVPLVDVYVDSIKDPKTTSKVVVELNFSLPITELTHLKRVKAGEILLFPVGDIEKDRVHNILKDKKFDITMLKNHVRIVSVARLPPRTKKQYSEVHKYWPCNFHSDKYLEKLSTNALFSFTEIIEHEKFMKMAVKVAQYCKMNDVSDRNVGVVIIDPKISSVVAVGYSDVHKNPIQHAPMVAIDNIARTQNGGAWNSVGLSPIDCSDLNLSGIPSKILSMLKENFENAKFGASWFKEKSDLLEPSDGPYLCTGYYVYVTHEPCVMCAMALIHSRVKRMFYGASSSNGALGTLCKVHTVKDLNHHYEVFAGLCKEECNSLEL